MGRASLPKRGWEPLSETENDYVLRPMATGDIPQIVAIERAADDFQGFT